MRFKVVFLCLLILLLGGCEDFIGGTINEDPNSPTAVPISVHLPAIGITVADVYGGEFSRINAVLTQQVEGVARSLQPFNYASLTPERFDITWKNIYEGILNEISISKEVAQENAYKHHEAVLKILEAFTLMTATDVWDDIPYSEAFQGVDVLSPTYDSQASIYQTINRLLDEALQALDEAAGALVLGNEDVFYGGNLDLWKKAALAVKARSLLHNKYYLAATNSAIESFSDPTENLIYSYPGEKAAGQWYRFNRDRTGDLSFSPSMRNLMIASNDTMRLFQMDQVFDRNHTFLIADFQQELISYRELQFIIAEGDVRANEGGTTVGHSAYLAGIKASFERLNAEGYEDYIAQGSVNPGVGNLTLSHVMIQKYIAMFLQPEAYNDWRRTGIPTLSPITTTLIPVRWDYVRSEYMFNENAPIEGSINIYTDRVGWNR